MSIKTKMGAFALCSLSLIATSCGEGNNEQKTTDSSQATTAPAKEITTSAVPASPEFDGAELAITSVTAEKVGTDSAKLTFNYGVKNYDLKSQTPDAGGKGCNNSEKGQHIHFILDNKPYTALYEPKHTVTVPLNEEEHYVMSFLSRSYHESVKTKGAALVYHFKLDAGGKLQKLPEPTTPMVFYSRPKGDYLGKDTANVLFDFYVWNATLGADYKVNAKISSGGLEKTMDVTAWKPQFLHGLNMGKSSITLTLMDKDGKVVEGPNTTVTREFNLAADEPMK